MHATRLMTRWAWLALLTVLVAGCDDAGSSGAPDGGAGGEGGMAGAAGEGGIAGEAGNGGEAGEGGNGGEAGNGGDGAPIEGVYGGDGAPPAFEPIPAQDLT